MSEGKRPMSENRKIAYIAAIAFVWLALPAFLPAIVVAVLGVPAFFAGLYVYNS